MTTISLYDYSRLSKTEIYKAYNSYYDNVREISASLEIEINTVREGKVESQSIDAELYFNKNDTLYLELNYSVIGIGLEAAKLFLNNNQYIFTTRNNNFIQGIPSDKQFNRLFGIRIPLLDWPETLFLNHQALDTVKMETDKRSAHEINLIYPDKVIKFSKEAPLIQELIQFTDDKKELYRIKTFDLFEVNGILFPKSIRYLSKRNNVEMILSYKSITINPQDVDKDFQLKVPYGMEQIIYDY